jgi:hypothetical protein
MRRLLPLVTAACIVATSAPAHAGSKSKTSTTPTKAAPDPTKDPIVQRILSDLQPLHPHLTAQEIVRTSNADLRKMYTAMYIHQGMKLLDAKHKAADIPLKG